MLTSTSFTHPTVKTTMLAAMRSSVAMAKEDGYGVAYVHNKAGEPFVRVKYSLEQGFTFSNKNEIICEKVLTGLRKGVKIDLSIK